MDKAKLTFLGTGSAIPTARRNHPAIFVEYNGENILFDCGEGTQRQFRIAKINPCRITRIFISHWHGDHILGLSGLLQTLSANGYTKDLVICGPKGSKQKFQELVAPHLRGLAYEISVKEIKEGGVIAEKDFKIETIGVDHDCNGLNYSFTIEGRKRLDVAKLKKLGDFKGPVVGELAKGRKVKIAGKTIDGSKMVYVEPERKLSLVFDTRYKLDLKKFVKGSTILVNEANYFDEDELAREHGHMTAMQAAGLAKDAKVDKLLLFHFSQRLEAIMKDVEKSVRKKFKESVLCRDFDSFEF
jgi:ribonuclease Z